MEYYQAHCLFRNKITDEKYPSLSDHPKIEGIILNQDDSLRSPEFVKQIDDYQIKLVESEQEIRKQFGI